MTLPAHSLLNKVLFDSSLLSKRNQKDITYLDQAPFAQVAIFQREH